MINLTNACTRIAPSNSMQNQICWDTTNYILKSQRLKYRTRIKQENFDYLCWSFFFLYYFIKLYYSFLSFPFLSSSSLFVHYYDAGTSSAVLFRNVTGAQLHVMTVLHFLHLFYLYFIFLFFYYWLLLMMDGARSLIHVLILVITFYFIFKLKLNFDLSLLSFSSSRYLFPTTICPPHSLVAVLRAKLVFYK